MIPKIIHYCWLSNEPYPNKIVSFMDSWKKYLHGYEFKKWDTNMFVINSIQWVKQAYENKKYAFAADYIRLYALYNYGGIYLDTDVQILRSFDDLLDLPHFIGFDSQNQIEAAVIGASKNSDWIYKCLSYYENRNFMDENHKMDLIPLPIIMRKQIEEIWKIKCITDKNMYSWENTKNIFYVFPYGYFGAKRHDTGAIEITKNTYSIHHCAMSWLPNNLQKLSYLKQLLMKIFGVEIINRFISLFSLRKLKQRFLK
jgi:mannosyltransferase OCH1-like enzyme